MPDISAHCRHFRKPHRQQVFAVLAARTVQYMSVLHKVFNVASASHIQIFNALTGRYILQVVPECIAAATVPERVIVTLVPERVIPEVVPELFLIYLREQ